MARWLVVLFVLAGILVLGNWYQFLVDYGMSPENAKLVADVLEQEHRRDPSVRLDFMIALMYTESAFRNVLGDDGKSVGYFQLTKEAVWYVAYYDEEVARFYRQLKSHTELLNFPDWQARIAYRYVSLLLKARGDYVSAMELWNGKGYFFVVHAKWTELFAELPRSYVQR